MSVESAKPSWRTLPGDLDQALDVGVVGELSELERFVEGDQRRHPVPFQVGIPAKRR